MALVVVQVVQCDACRGMLTRTAGDDTVTQDINEAATFLSKNDAYHRARARGWRIWTGFHSDGSEYVSRADCPKDIT